MRCRRCYRPRVPMVGGQAGTVMVGDLVIDSDPGNPLKLTAWLTPCREPVEPPALCLVSHELPCLATGAHLRDPSGPGPSGPHRGIAGASKVSRSSNLTLPASPSFGSAQIRVMRSRCGNVNEASPAT